AGRGGRVGGWRHRRSSDVDAHIAAFYPSQFLKPLLQRFDANLSFCVISDTHKDADPPHPLALLRARRERPRDCRAAEQRDEPAPLHRCNHSITSSPVASSVGGTVTPSALAVFTLTASSNRTGCSTGRSAGCVPCRILCTYPAARRYRSGRLGP